MPASGCHDVPRSAAASWARDEADASGRHRGNWLSSGAGMPSAVALMGWLCTPVMLIAERKMGAASLPSAR